MGRGAVLLVGDAMALHGGIAVRRRAVPVVLGRLEVDDISEPVSRIGPVVSAAASLNHAGRPPREQCVVMLADLCLERTMVEVTQ
jgi:hypothetical protein